MTKVSFDEFIRSRAIQEEAIQNKREKLLGSASHLLEVYVSENLAPSRFLKEANIHVLHDDNGFSLGSEKGSLVVFQNGLSASVADSADRKQGGAVIILDDDGFNNIDFEVSMNELIFQMLAKKQMLKV